MNPAGASRILFRLLAALGVALLLCNLPAPAQAGSWSVRYKVAQMVDSIAEGVANSVGQSSARPLKLTFRSEPASAVSAVAEAPLSTGNARALPLSIRTVAAADVPHAAPRAEVAQQPGAKPQGMWAKVLGLGEPEQDTESKAAPRGSAHPSGRPEPAQAAPAAQTGDIPRRDKIISTAAIVKNSTMQPAAPSAPLPASCPTSRDRRALSIARQQDGGVLVFRVEGGQPLEYKTFLTADGKKRVVDLRGCWRYDGNPTQALNSGSIKALRVGEHPDMLRLVFDYDGHEAARPSMEATDKGLAIAFRMS